MLTTTTGMNPPKTDPAERIVEATETCRSLAFVRSFRTQARRCRSACTVLDETRKVILNLYKPETSVLSLIGYHDLTPRTNR